MKFGKDKTKDVQIGMKNVPESVDFKFFETLQNYDKSILIEIRELKKSIDKLRHKIQFKVIALTVIATFAATMVLCLNTGFDDFVMRIIGSFR